MKHQHLFACMMLGLSALVGCSGDDGEIAVDAAATPLTAQGSDKLFTIRVVEAREGGYALDGLSVKVITEDDKTIDVNCTPHETNGNNMLETNDTLDCVESAENQLGPELAGKEVDVELHAKVDGEDETVGSATWTPK